jgi:hypothetical protein
MLTRLNITLFFSFIIILSLNYCMDSKNVVPLIEADYYECHNQEDWDSLSVCNLLTYSWLQNPVKYSMSGKKALSGGSYQLVFTGDFKLNVYKHQELYAKATWNIKGEGNSFTLTTEPFIERAYGTIFFCEDKMEFLNSWVDGCDFFLKKESY